MSVLIKGMDMPHEEYCNIRLYPSGKVSVSYFDAKLVTKAIEVKAPRFKMV